VTKKKSKRELVFEPTPSANLVVCICGRCRWVASVEYSGAQTPEQAARSAFDAHDCENFPVREDSSYMPKEKLLPHLIPDGRLQRCSVCGYPFEPDVKPSMSVAFSDHLSKAHKPGQTTEDFNQAAARVVRESTEKD
jgi:hypothetical protein